MAAEYDLNLAIPLAAKSSSATMVKWTAWYIVNRLADQNISVGTTFSDANWTFVESCDGTNAPAAGNQWTTTFDATKIVQASAGTNHSWAVIANSTLGVWLIVDCVSTTGCDFVLTYAAPSGGTVTDRPTAVVEVKFGVTAADGQNMQLNNGDTSIAQYVHTYHDASENVYFYTSFAGSAKFFSMLAIAKCTNVTTGDNRPTAMFFSGGGEPGLSVDPINSSLFNYNSYGRPSKLRGVNYAGSATVAMAAGMPCVYDGTTLIPSLTTSGYVNADNDGTTYYNEFPLVVFAKGPTDAAMKGILPNIKLASGTLSEMAEIGSAPITAVKFGDCWVPWDGNTSPLV